MGELTREITSSSYRIKIDDIEDFLNICGYSDELLYEDDSRPLWKRLDDIRGVDEIDYNGHFGSNVWLTVEESYNSNGTWIDIFQTINDYIQEAGEFYEKENQDKDDCED